ncbi:hypothetical protein FGO68_gene5580 [Halteria grandinella]|uniref:Uncharacterized protein n=1 Tax=Halteria grandinella TaxID=5974 RepID=A0A8J8P0C1_HALGN|nr:hypothetical protein FGO68_gene5580 [Halteria grandinella]
MGQLLTSLSGIFFSKPEMDFKLVMIGLDSAGKTTILYKMKLDQPANALVSTAPTIGYNLEEFEVKNVKIKVWDLSGQERMRHAWKYYFETVNGVIFVIDSADRARINDVRDELHQILGELMGGNNCGVVPLLILANKQDVQGALGYSELRDSLALCGDYEKRGRIRIQEASALQDKGLTEGFEWIVEEIGKVSKEGRQAAVKKL